MLTVKKNLIAVVALLMVLALLAACGPTPEPQVMKETVVVTEKETVVVTEKETVVVTEKETVVVIEKETVVATQEICLRSFVRQEREGIAGPSPGCVLGSRRNSSKVDIQAPRGRDVPRRQAVYVGGRRLHLPAYLRP
jgi:hypothetical protein